MSEYQYYEFLALDRPLDEAARQALRELSSRARITATSFTNSYQWGDFKGDPTALMERWFDFHLYVANWGSRRLMVRFPKRLVDRRRLAPFLHEVDFVTLKTSGENLIVDIQREEVEGEDDDDGSGWLAALAPLRADVLAGDLRFFYLLWLAGIETDDAAADEREPLPGIGTLTGALEAFASFLDLDPDLVQAAAERPTDAVPAATAAGDVRKIISAMSDRDKVGMLERLFEGDPHVGAELRAAVRDLLPSPAGASPVAARTVAELQARAEAIRLERTRAAAKKVAADRQLQAREAERAQNARLAAIERRGAAVWEEVEGEIERRNAPGYDIARTLLVDLKVLAEQRGTLPDFFKRLETIRERHARKKQFLNRIEGLGPSRGS